MRRIGFQHGELIEVGQQQTMLDHGRLTYTTMPYGHA
jgi:hypothetical protein